VGDPQGRVMDFQNRPIDGLYITGNSMAMLEVGAGYQSGVANARAMTFGFLAARHAAQLG
jgi:3-oxosteroid 1-dehydrogenase